MLFLWRRFPRIVFAEHGQRLRLGKGNRAQQHRRESMDEQRAVQKGVMRHSGWVDGCGAAVGCHCVCRKGGRDSSSKTAPLQDRRVSFARFHVKVA